MRRTSDFVVIFRESCLVPHEAFHIRKCWLLKSRQLICEGCFCRLRIGAAAPSRTPCPNRVSAFEKAVRSYTDNPAENVITPVIGTTFDSLGEAYDLYNLYSWEKGFGFRYGKRAV